MSRRRSRPPSAPVELVIDGLSHEGRGVGRIDGKTIFVHGALPGERVQARILRSKASFADAETISVLAASSERIEPACPHFGVCGGCALQHLNEDSQLKHKEGVLLELLKHHASCQPETLATPIRGPQWGYRRKARLGVKFVQKKGGVIVGFRERAKPYVTDCASCAILDPRVSEQLPALRELVQNLSIPTRIPQIEIAAADDVIALVFRHLDPLTDDDRAALAQYAQKSGFDIYLQSGGPDTVTALAAVARPLVYALDNLELHFEADDFTQVNAAINQQMVATALGYLDLHPHDVVADLFCGIGNFTLPIARRAASVVGFEGEGALIKRAERNAQINNISNCTFEVADLSNAAALAQIALAGVNKLLLDPPRAGALEVIEAMDFADVSRLVYVSCNAVTFARDTAALRARHGYHLRECGILDMFPQTSHFESIALFDRA